MLKNTSHFWAFGPHQANNYEKIENDKQLMRFNTLYFGGSYRHMWTYVCVCTKEHHHNMGRI